MGAVNNRQQTRARMTLSTSRQQFLAYESHHTPEEIQYGRRGGVFISTCVCIIFIIFALVAAVLVGLIVYYITYFKLAHKSADFWDENEPFSQSNLSPSPDLRLPSHIAPSFYRLKLKTDLEKSTFTGDISITIRATKKVKEIILHSKNLTINNNAKLTEQIYEKVGTLHASTRKRRDTSEINSTDSSPTREPAQTTLMLETITAPTITEVANSTDSTVSTSTTTEKFPEVVETVLPTTVLPQTPSPTPIDTSVVHSSVRNINILSITHSKGDRLILSLATILKPHVDYTLELSFEGTISNALTGFYKSTYANNQSEVRNLGVTQFEPISARAAFPCFDEPAFKAKFEISIAHSRNISVLSNMKVASTEFILEEPGWQWTHFERSVRMSTYLVAYVLSDFQSIETSYLSTDNTTKVVKVWTRSELLHKAKYALSITPKLLRYYEDVFGVPYVLDKIDLIAIPDFSSGAMENWGLVTFRETTLLYDESTNVPREKQNVCVDVAHELAHQWFGNLVTMRWWTDLWLNEGFATYIEYVGVNQIEPDWNMLEYFTKDKMNLLRSDCLKNTSPVSKKVMDAGEISQKFDEISYTKGANLIRMLNHTLTEEVFKKGLAIYLDNWKYKNAEENDLWKAMSSAVDDSSLNHQVSIVDFMNKWTRQAGYPVVTVDRNYYTGEVNFEQVLFTTDESTNSKLKSQLWYIPISYTNTDAPLHEWSTSPKLWLKEKSTLVRLPLNNSQALYVNVGGIGYYRVNYDQQNWDLLTAAVKSGLIKSPEAKAQLIDDAFNLAKLGQLNYSVALELSTCVMNGEDSRLVWEMLISDMAFLKYNLRKTSGYVYFQDYMRLLLSKQLETLNYGLNPPRDDNEAFLVENLLGWACAVDEPRCLRWATEHFQRWMDTPGNNTIPSYLRNLVYNTAVKHGGRREFEFLWNMFNNETDPAVKSLIISALPSTREEALVTMLLENSLTTIPKQYAIAVWNVLPPIGSRLAQDFLIANFDRVYQTFTEMDAFMFPTVLAGCFGSISDHDELMKLKTFALSHKEKLMAMSQTLQKLVDSANLRMRWMKHAPAITAWFRDYLHGRSSQKPITNITTTSPNTAEETTNHTSAANATSSVEVTLNATTPSDTTLNVTTPTAASPSVTSPPVSNTSPPVSNTLPPVSDASPPVSEASPPVSDTSPPVSDTSPLTLPSNVTTEANGNVTEGMSV